MLNYSLQVLQLGHQMTHSIDSFITDSANSATALYTGHKSTVNALGVYADTSADPFDDPKFETILEMFTRLTGGKVGIVSTAFIADATPAAFTVHTRDRGEYGAVIDSFIHGVVNYTWTEWPGYDVIFGGKCNLSA
jgi:alkaline phosphatase